MEKTSENLEHIEHTQHAAHDPFARNVATTMAIVAAILACVTMLSHQAHNETLRLQAEANGKLTEADILKTDANDKWSYYQAKNIRKHEYEAMLQLLEVVAEKPASESNHTKIASDWEGKVKQYARELPVEKKEAEELEREAKECKHQSKEATEGSEKAHHRGIRYDMSELAVEISLVLSSIALLTKRAVFWFAGLGAGGIGIVLALTALFLH
jgi:hypothetical protein